jgi:hypothetical protein
LGNIFSSFLSSSCSKRASPKAQSPSRSDFSRSDYEKEENWVSECGDESDQSDSQDSDDIDGIPLPIHKTTSMSNFYYKKSRSSEELLQALVRMKSA